MKEPWLLVALLAASPLQCGAEVYKCTDSTGQTIYQPTPCPGGSKLDIGSQARPNDFRNALKAPVKPLPLDLTDEQLADVVRESSEAVKLRLKDPDSATFRHVRVTKQQWLEQPHVFVCGEVNAKNSFGGYTGFQYFFVYEGPLGPRVLITETLLGSVDLVGNRWYQLDDAVMACMTSPTLASRLE